VLIIELSLLLCNIGFGAWTSTGTVAAVNGEAEVETARGKKIVLNQPLQTPRRNNEHFNSDLVAYRLHSSK